MTWCDGQGVKRGNGSGSRASSCGRPGASLPRLRGPLDQADRRPSRPLSSDGQGVLLRPDERKARAVKARYVGVCCGCGAYTRPRNGKGDAYACCSACHPGGDRAPLDRQAGAQRDARVARPLRLAATSYDWSRTRRAAARGEPLERLSTDDWPSAGVVTAVYGTRKAARAAAAKQFVQSGDGNRRSRERRP